MSIAVTAIGVATAQGNSRDLLSREMLHTPRAWPWPPDSWVSSRLCYPALGLASTLKGPERWRALAREAIKDCFADRELTSQIPPLIVGSCNGAAHNLDEASWQQAFDSQVLLEGTPWSRQRQPVFSASCASGGHALYAANLLLTADLADEVLVLAADMLSPSNHENFEGLRILSDQPASPWQSTSTGFLLGEAAVVLRLTRVSNNEGYAFLDGPVLAGDLPGTDGLVHVLRQLVAQDARLVIGQGTGPLKIDQAELDAVGALVDRNIPITTPLVNFGHTLGASGLLSIALAVLSRNSAGALNCLSHATGKTIDGRPLLNGFSEASEVLVTCRALSGACTATLVGDEAQSRHSEPLTWKTPVAVGPLTHPFLRSLAAKALNHRPEKPPDILVIRLDRPLSPPARAVIGERLLPSAVLEVTPGFVSQLVARCWGFDGPALCLVGAVDSDDYGLRKACERKGLNTFQINLRGSGDACAIEWNV